jgi:LPS export ABC transporter protein LptC
MAVSLRNSLAIALLSAAALASWYWSRQPPVRTSQAAAGAPPGYYLRGARLVGTDESGDVVYRMRADDLAEQPERELLEMRGVELEYLSPQRDQWSISAERATAPKDRSIVDLEGAVRIVNRPADGGMPLSIETARLRFETAEAVVRTDAAVSVQVGSLQVSANGLLAHLKDDKLELESSVHGKLAR